MTRTIRPRKPAATKPSADAFARLFESVHEGVYIGTVNGTTSQTLAANPHLKVMFGYGVEAGEGEVQPFEIDRFVEQRNALSAAEIDPPQARQR